MANSIAARHLRRREFLTVLEVPVRKCVETQDA
jgi:hypothetical protein